jgi:hypothetical protein
VPAGLGDLALVIVALLVIGALLALPQIALLVFMHWARTPVLKWVFLFGSVASAGWVAKAISVPFQTASSMAITTMNTPLVATGIVVILALGLLSLERRTG